MPGRPGAGATIAALVADAAATLERAGLTAQASRTDAEVLARHLLELDHADWLLRMRDLAPSGFDRALAAAVARRARREPVAYITGWREFYGRRFRVTPDVLIPRPETELVVDEALSAIDRRRAGSAGPVRVADVGTGSGCIAVTLALERLGAEVVATDISAAALAVAEANAARLGARVRFIREALLGGAADAFGVVVSNPPYIPEPTRRTLMPDVRDYEPPTALFGGSDGLDVLRALLPAARRALLPGGSLIVEIGSDQDANVRQLMAAVPELSLVTVRSDLAGLPRILVAMRRPAPAGTDPSV